jgi:2-polyprenyl-3-methyl-5-hydroxy-6-metoxy-1,4-benzoquinol methylase
LVKNILPYRPNEITIEAWNKTYANGGWDHIRQIDEFGRYSVIAGYIQHAKNSEKILDVGCGEGILQERLCESKYSRYVGIDISRVAIERATRRRNGKSTFLISSIEGFDTSEKFDVIIFNECLYYFQDPLAILEKYKCFLEKNGVLIMSMYASDNTMKLWKMIDRRYSVEDEVKVTNKEGVEWIVRFIIP